MIRFCVIILICFFLNAQCLFASIHVDNIDQLNHALRGTNFHPLNFLAPANDLKFTTTTGQKTDLKQFRGKLIILTFWTVNTAKWSEEALALEKLHSKYSERGLEVIGLNLVDSIDVIKTFLKANHLDIQVGFNEHATLSVNRKNFTGNVSTAFVTDRNAVAIYEIPAYPTTYIIDRNGRTLGFFVGRVDWDSIQLQRALEAVLEPTKVELALQEDSAFQSDAGQGITLPPQPQVMGGPTKKGPTQTPLGPQAPIPDSEEKPKEDIKSLPFHPSAETRPKKSPSSKRTTGQSKTPGRKSPSSSPGAISHESSAPHSARPALPTTGEKPGLRDVSGNLKSAPRNIGQLPPAKPYYPSGNSPIPIQPDNAGKVTATIPGAGPKAPPSAAGYPVTGASELPAALPLPNRNQIGVSILDSFGSTEKALPQSQQTTSERTGSETQPSNILEQIGQDVMSLGEGIRGTFSKLLGSR
jgi:peroxiredoxin